MSESDLADRLDAGVTRALSRLAPPAHPEAATAASDQSVPPDPRLVRVLAASDFAADVLARQPDLLARLLSDDGAAPSPPPVLAADATAEWPAQLRRYRVAESTRLVWRDVFGLDDVDDTLAGSTTLAERCLGLALDALEAVFANRHGVVRSADGRVQRLVVFGLGKLGGGELNFSSDIDIVYAYPEAGESDGPRPLAAEDWFARLGQQLAKLLDETTADGFCHRVDLRLRPFGTAGRIALSFAAMEQYFQREGRDWERYAWQKARPVAGDLAAGEDFLATLRPFVYRRYLDYGALDGLRDMKAAIAAEVARQELADDIKRGDGGIREIEFLAQALQLIRGGREASLRERRLQPALRALAEARQMSATTVDDLLASYRFLRRLENRLQMLRDAQTHVLPMEPLDRLRIARGLGFDHWDTLRAELDVHRTRVSSEFATLLSRRKPVAPAGNDLAAYWRGLPAGGDASPLEAAGFGDAPAVDATLRDFARSPAVGDLSDIARARLDRVMPVLLQASAPADRPLLAVRRLLALLHNILRRASYLALLDEQPAALARLIDLVVRSAFLAERLAAHPLLLDELLDARAEGPLPTRAAMVAQCTAVLKRDDLEASLYALNEIRQALSFRIALATLDRRQDARASTTQLAWLADAVVQTVATLATRDLAAPHGTIANARFAVIGYGSVGGGELGIGSDLDLVFLYDAPGDATSDGARTLDAPRWHARLAQKIVSLLGTVTGAGRLYEVDVRLRPDGASGLLVSSLSSYDDYQRNRAWTWEHQALVRARGLAGDASLLADFERIRAEVLAAPRDGAKLLEDVSAMRRRMRAELDRSRDGRFDLKQGEGGLVDLEFLLQFVVLREAPNADAWIVAHETAVLIEVAETAGVFAPDEATALREAHATLLAAGLACTLDRRPRQVPEDDAIVSARAAIRAAVQGQGLVFDATA